MFTRAWSNEANEKFDYRSIATNLLSVIYLIGIATMWIMQSIVFFSLHFSPTLEPKLTQPRSFALRCTISSMQTNWQQQRISHLMQQIIQILVQSNTNNWWISLCVCVRDTENTTWIHSSECLPWLIACDVSSCKCFLCFLCLLSFLFFDSIFYGIYVHLHTWKSQRTPFDTLPILEVIK